MLRLIRSHRDAPQLPEIKCSKQWIANCRACTEGPANVLKYHARYTKRGPLPEKNILNISNEQITFRYISHRTKRPEQCKLHPQEFLRRYLQHTPQPGFHRIRYYGFLAPGNRRTLKAIRVTMITVLSTLASVIAELATTVPETTRILVSSLWRYVFHPNRFHIPKSAGSTVARNSMNMATAHFHLLYPNATTFVVRGRILIAWIGKSARKPTFFPLYLLPTVLQKLPSSGQLSLTPPCQCKNCRV